MKYVICSCNILLCIIVFGFAAVGLAVHRAHALSVAVEIVKSYNLSDSDRNSMETLVRSTGNTKFYYSTIVATVEIGLIFNVAFIGYWIYDAVKTARKHE